MKAKSAASKPPLKIAIVGAAPSSRKLAPFNDPSWQIWGCSPSNRPGTKEGIKRVDVWFELHALADLGSELWSPWAKPYIEWMKAQPGVVMQEVNDLVPNAQAFPRDEINAKLGGLFLTSTIAWQIARVVLMHQFETPVAELGIFGVDMSAQSEYDYERPGCKYWIERARAAGITVHVPPQSDLDQPGPQYGFDDASPMAIKMKVHSMELQDRLDQLAAECAQLDARKAECLKQHNYISGALEQNNFVRKTWVSFSGPDMR